MFGGFIQEWSVESRPMGRRGPFYLKIQSTCRLCTLHNAVAALFQISVFDQKFCLP